MRQPVGTQSTWRSRSDSATVMPALQAVSAGCEGVERFDWINEIGVVVGGAVQMLPAPIV